MTKHTHSLTGVITRDDRFTGYQLPRDRDNNIIMPLKEVNQPEYWKTRAMSFPDNLTEVPFRGPSQ